MIRTLPELQQTNDAIVRHRDRLRFLVRHSTDGAVGQYVGDWWESMERESEPLRLSSDEHKRKMQGKKLEATLRVRRLLAGHPMHLLIGLVGLPDAPIGPFVRDLNDTEQSMLHDAGLTFPQAFDRLSNGEMLNAGLYHLLAGPRIDAMSPAELRAMLEKALASPHLAVSRLDCELVERRVASGGLARDVGDVGTVRELADRVRELQAARVPPEFANWRETCEAAFKVIGRAKLAGLVPVDLEKQREDVLALCEAEEQALQQLEEGAAA
jgi:hypothetical protein